jgi:hypothetical protein
MLTVRDHMTLKLEETRWNKAGMKEQQIRELFDESPTRYYQRLSRLIERPEAMAAYPMLVRRLQRLAATRRRARTAV